MSHVLSIQDLSCVGRCSLTVALPVLSAMGHQCSVLPTAVLSTHTGFPAPGGWCWVSIRQRFISNYRRKTNNINLVTPGQYVPHIIEAVESARRQGLRIPIVYNTGSYEKVDTLKMLEGIVDIYLPDFKYMSRQLAKAYSKAEDYPKIARDCIAKAKANNVPNDNIERIIKKASGDGDGNNYEAITYEGYGPSGIAVIVETLTDNRNRTAGDVIHYFDKFGGNMGQPGCVSFMFSQKGVLIVDREECEADEDKVMEDALECGAADVRELFYYPGQVL